MEEKLFTLGFLVYWITLILLTMLAEHKSRIKALIYAIILLISFTVIMIGFEEMTEKRIAKKFLKGEKPYRMEIRYEIRDSIVTSVDTVYIKKEKK